MNCPALELRFQFDYNRFKEGGVAKMFKYVDLYDELRHFFSIFLYKTSFYCLADLDFYSFID